MSVRTAHRLLCCFLLSMAGFSFAACASDEGGTASVGERDTGRRPGRGDVEPSDVTGDAGNTGEDASQADSGSGSEDDTTSEPDIVAEEDAGADAVEEVESDVPRITGAVIGTVWAPGNAPGMVPAGQEIPISNAVVYVQHDRPEAVPDAVYCENCELIPEASTMTDARGRFGLGSVVPGDYWLIIQKGQFRIEQDITVVADQTLEIPTAQTTLSAEHIPEAGLWAPRIAVAMGTYDHIEDVLGKMGMGTVDAYGEVDPATFVHNVDLWDNGGGTSGTTYEGTLTALVSDLNRMLDYHIIFIPCGGNNHTAALDNQEVLQNIRDYVALGGKLYVTDWSGEWMDAVFPAQITLAGEGIDTPASAWDPETLTWNPDLFGSANGDPYDTFNASAVDEDLRAWLDGQVGPTAFGLGGATTFDAYSFGIQGSWNTITRVTPITLGVDDEGEPVIDTPHVYVTGGTVLPEPRYPMTVTFEPVGCGRVLYSTYHTTDESHVGLTPQERILLYLIMEIGVCKSGKQYVDP